MRRPYSLVRMNRVQRIRRHGVSGLADPKAHPHNRDAIRSAVRPLQTVVAVFGGLDERKYNSEPGGNDE